MSTHTDILARVRAFADRNGLKAETVVRKATGDPRGLARLEKKLETVEAVSAWLDENEVTIGTSGVDAPSADQEAVTETQRRGEQA